MRTKRRLIAATGLVILAILVLLQSCMTFRMHPKKIDAYFQSRQIPVRQEVSIQGNRKTHYVSTGDETKPLVLFVHGSPGSLSAFIHMLADTQLLAKHLLITADRPGFGYSNFGVAEPSLKKQAALLKPILEKYGNNHPIILVGHSLGAPVIAQLAIDYPHLVDGLVMVAGSIDPELEPNEMWFRAPLASPFLSWLLPRSWRASNDEIYQLKPELERMLPLWEKIRCPVVFVQGEKDRLVDPRNVAFGQRMMKNASVSVISKADMDHFVPWSNPELIREALGICDER